MTLRSPTTDEPLERIIARVVRDVLQGTPREEGARERTEAAARADGTLHLPDAVLALSALDGRLDGVRRIAVAPRCVVTPAVRDELRRRRIELLRGAPPAAQREAAVPAPADASPAAAARLLADIDRRDRVAGFARQLAARGLPTSAAADLDAVVRGLAAKGARAVVLAELPQPVVCAACRHPHVRAAHVRGIAEVARVAAAMGPNLWVLDMETLNFAGAVATAAACFRAAPDTPV